MWNGVSFGRPTKSYNAPLNADASSGSALERNVSARFSVDTARFPRLNRNNQFAMSETSLTPQ
jgi:hypothetical protein